LERRPTKLTTTATAARPMPKKRKAFLISMRPESYLLVATVCSPRPHRGINGRS
jgi:hypothetical protein